jgi:ribose transport system ATP-binding protein
LLNATGIDKRFGAVSVLEGVALHLRAGEVHALMGQNGAETGRRTRSPPP